MNQQNKTERWEETNSKGYGWRDLNKILTKWGVEPHNSASYEIFKLISQLLSDARREERERCLEAIKPSKIKEILCPANPKFKHTVCKKGIKSVCYQCGQTIYFPKVKTPRQAILALTTAEESIKKIKVT